MLKGLHPLRYLYNMMNKDLEYYERKMRDLQVENQVLRGQLSNSSRTYNQVTPETIICS